MLSHPQILKYPFDCTEVVGIEIVSVVSKWQTTFFQTYDDRLVNPHCSIYLVGIIAIAGLFLISKAFITAYDYWHHTTP
jgi:hypothetical protein